MMDLRKAVLVKRQSDNGYFSTKKDVELGTEYFVDMNTKRIGTFQNIESRNFFNAEYVEIVENGAYVGHILTELLEIQKPN